MSGIYYGLTMVAVFLVIRWFIENDTVSPEQRTTGFLAIRNASDFIKKKRKGGPVSLKDLG